VFLLPSKIRALPDPRDPADNHSARQISALEPIAWPTRTAIVWLLRDIQERSAQMEKIMRQRASAVW
jgi:hypothetical protein